MGSLQGVKVLDLSRVFSGPWAAQMLADFGADVIKVERPGRGDDVRHQGVFLRDSEGRATGESSSFLAMNRGKRSVTIDLAHPDGQALVRELAAGSDILIENFKAGDLARYGLDHASLQPVNPGLIYCSITGFGQTGPYSHHPRRSSAAPPRLPPQPGALGGLPLQTGLWRAGDPSGRGLGHADRPGPIPALHCWPEISTAEPPRNVSSGGSPQIHSWPTHRRRQPCTMACRTGPHTCPPCPAKLGVGRDQGADRLACRTSGARRGKRSLSAALAHPSSAAAGRLCPQRTRRRLG